MSTEAKKAPLESYQFIARHGDEILDQGTVMAKNQDQAKLKIVLGVVKASDKGVDAWDVTIDTIEIRKFVD